MRNTHPVAIVIAVVACTSGCYFGHRKIKAMSAEKHKLASSSNGAISKVKERREPFTQTELRSIFAKLEAGGEDEYFLHAKAVNCQPRWILPMKGRYYALTSTGGKPPSERMCKSLESLSFMVNAIRAFPLLAFEIDDEDFRNEWTQSNGSVACQGLPAVPDGLKPYTNTAAHSILIPTQKARDENIEYTCENQDPNKKCMTEPQTVAWRGLKAKTVLVAKRSSHDEFMQLMMNSLDKAYMNCLDKTSKQVVELQEVLRRAVSTDFDISSEPNFYSPSLNPTFSSVGTELKRQAFDAANRFREEDHDEVREEERQIQVNMHHPEHRAGASCVGHVVAHAVVMLLLMWSV